MKIKRQGGFTLVEVIVVAGIIAILAGIMVPMIFKEIDESKKTRAAADVRSISSAMLVFKKDTGDWPIKGGTCDPNVTFLYGSGTLPLSIADTGFDTSVSASYSDYLSTDANDCWPAPQWQGPYMAVVNEDPWGHTYITNVNNFSIVAAPVWILSAGPDGTFNTNSTDTVLCGATPGCDDIGLRIK